MPASFPISIRVFTAKADLTDTNYAAHINDLQDEVVAIENILGSAPQGGSATVKARVAAVEAGKAPTVHTHTASQITDLGTGDPASQYMLKSIGTAAGDMVYWSGAGTPVRRAIGSNGQVWTVIAGLPGWAAAPATVTTATFTESKTWTISNPVVAAGELDFINPFIVRPTTGEHIFLASADHYLSSASSTVNFSVLSDSTGITGFTGLTSNGGGSVYTNPADVELSAGARIHPVINSLTGTPTNWALTLTLLHVVTLT
jgi:hypothetical protein